MKLKSFFLIFLFLVLPASLISAALIDSQKSNYLVTSDGQIVPKWISQCQTDMDAYITYQRKIRELKTLLEQERMRRQLARQ